MEYRHEEKYNKTFLYASMTTMIKKLFTLVPLAFIFCSGLFALSLEDVAAEEFIDELKQERFVSVIHDEGDERLLLVPDCIYRKKIFSRRIEKEDRPYTAEFLYLISKRDVLSCGKKGLQQITMEDISEVFTALSKMSGMRYRFSNSNPNGSVLYKKVSTIGGLEKARDIPDMVTRDCDGLNLYCYQHDRLLGNLKFLLEYEMTENELYLSILNKSNIGLLGLNACKVENLRINIHVTDLGDDILFYISADANYDNVLKLFSIRKIIKGLMNERLNAIYRWFFLQF